MRVVEVGGDEAVRGGGVELEENLFDCSVAAFVAVSVRFRQSRAGERKSN